MGLTVFDSDVLIGFLNGEDANHVDADARVRAAVRSGDRCLVCAVNYTEVLVGPVRAGAAGAVDEMLGYFGFEIIQADQALAQRAAAVRARTNLKVPDAYALATVIHAEHRGWDDVRLATFDRRLMTAFAELHPN
ncbi:MAG: type II toxin-antitoxin system VapC family toxin [Thermoleophilia bacterium]